MSCNCNNTMSENTTIQFIKGTTRTLNFNFDIDISSFDSAKFTIRKDYATTPIIEKTINDLSGNTLTVNLAPDDTNLFTSFLNGRNSAEYIWGLDIVKNSEIYNVFPRTGNPAPLCIVFKHVVED